jgi:hypothetical protein
MATEESRRSSPQLLASGIDRLPQIWRLLAGGIAGGFAGGLAAGLGARVAMRLIGMAAGEEAQGTAPTGEIVGRFTWLGTLGILEFAVIVGIGAGLYYVWIRRFVPFSGLMKGLAFGGILLTTLAIELMLSEELPSFDRQSSGSPSSLSCRWYSVWSPCRWQIISSLLYLRATTILVAPRSASGPLSAQVSWARSLLPSI